MVTEILANQRPPTIRVHKKAAEFTSPGFYTFYHLYHDMGLTCFSCLFVIKTCPWVEMGIVSSMSYFFINIMFKTFSRKISTLSTKIISPFIFYIYLLWFAFILIYADDVILIFIVIKAALNQFYSFKCVNVIDLFNVFIPVPSS